jgi:quercetin dioxygenase-like cupin family protein
MKLYHFDPQTAPRRTDFGSRGMRLARVARSSSGLSVVCVHLEADGVIARHKAAENQLLCVVTGSGEVSGEDGGFRAISAGIAAFWKQGEHHETRTASGLMALILEGPGLNPAQFLQTIEPD